MGKIMFCIHTAGFVHGVLNDDRDLMFSTLFLVKGTQKPALKNFTISCIKLL